METAKICQIEKKLRILQNLNCQPSGHDFSALCTEALSCFNSELLAVLLLFIYFSSAGLL